MAEGTDRGSLWGIVWSAVERFSVQGIQFLISIVIARHLLPSEYGLIGMLAIFLAIAQTFIDGGFSNALIQNQERNDVDFSTAFYFNAAMSTVLYLSLYFCADLIADFYRQPELKSLTRIIGINLIINGLTIVQKAKLSIQLDFKTQAKASVIAVTVGGSVGILLAYQDFGAWALVIQTLLTSSVNTVLLWILTKWTPLLIFSYQSFTRLFSYGSRVLFTSLVNTVYGNLYGLVIGRRFSSLEVGYYTRSYSLAQFPSSNIMEVISRALFPILCKIQDTNELRSKFVGYLRSSCFIVFPLMSLLFAVSQDLIQILLTSKWQGASSLLQLLSIAYLIFPIMAVNNEILWARARTDLMVRSEILRKVIATIILLSLLPFGVKMVCLGLIISNIADASISIFFSYKVIKVSVLEQLKVVFPMFVSSGLMVLLILFIITKYIDVPLLRFVVSIILGPIFYLFCCWFLKVKELRLLIDKGMQIIAREKKY